MGKGENRRGKGGEKGRKGRGGTKGEREEESRCGNCINYSVKLHKEKRHTEDIPEKSFSYATLRTK